MDKVIGRSSERVHGFPISVEINLYGTGFAEINTGIGFFDHMLELMAKHGQFDLKVSCSGDIHVDDHHTIDEIGMNLGLAFKRALDNIQNKITRYGFFILPMDEVLTTCAIDVNAKRQSFVYDVRFKNETLGTLKTDTLREFWSMFSQKLECNFVIKSEYGYNDHHIAEGMFKCVSHTLKEAVKIKEEAK